MKKKMIRKWVKNLKNWWTYRENCGIESEGRKIDKTWQGIGRLTRQMDLLCSHDLLLFGVTRGCTAAPTAAGSTIFSFEPCNQESPSDRDPNVSLSLSLSHTTFLFRSRQQALEVRLLTLIPPYLCLFFRLLNTNQSRSARTFVIQSKRVLSACYRFAPINGISDWSPT